MRMVFQIRGVTGAGKTTAMRNLLRSLGNPRTFRAATAHGPEAYTRAGQLVAIGDYNATAKCVGCDRIKGRAHIFDAVDAMTESGQSLVGLESMIFSTTFKMSNDLCRHVKAKGYDFILVFLDCDFATALERVNDRNGGKPISLVGLEHRISSYEKSRDKCIEAGIKNVRIDATRGERHILERLRSAVL